MYEMKMIDISKIINDEPPRMISLKLIEHIKEKGILNPIVIDENYKLLEGRSRFEIAKILDMKEIPCMIFTKD